MNPQVERIRKLLAKAASTDFPAEAHALRQKAVELQSRHGITEEMLAPPKLKTAQPFVMFGGFTVNTTSFDASNVQFDGDTVSVTITGIW